MSKHIVSLIVVVVGLLITVAVLRAEAPADKDKPVERTTETGLKITDLSAGDGVKVGDTVWVKYVGTLADGKKFDASDDHEETRAGLEITIGRKQVIAGWEEGIQGMKVGDSRKLVIPPNLGYGSQANGPIPANATLTFEVTLLGHKKKGN